MWTRKASFTFTGGIALILIGMMISNQQMMILGLTLVAFITVNSWIGGHGDVEIQRTLSADNLYKVTTCMLNYLSRTEVIEKPRLWRCMTTYHTK